jgi:transposase
MYSTDLRKAALRLHQIQHISFPGISSLLGMAASTVCRWVQNVQPKGWPRTGNRKFSDEMRTFVTEMIRRRPCATHLEIRDAVFEVYGVAMSRKLVGIALMGFFSQYIFLEFVKNELSIGCAFTVNKVVKVTRLSVSSSSYLFRFI